MHEKQHDLCSLPGIIRVKNQMIMMISAEHIAVAVYQTRQAVFDQTQRRVAFA